MKLRQIYANKNFKPVKFNDGLNVVLAKVTKKLDLNRDSHNLGKTSLIEVIDFLLLKNVGKDDLLLKFESFKDHVFFLEIVLGDGRFLTIRRSVKNATKISFKINETSTICLTESSWDKVDLPFSKARKYLNSTLDFSVLSSWDYRKSLTYFLRSQRDYHDVFQLNKFRKGKDSDWKPFMFDLLGFDGTTLLKKYKLTEQVQQLTSLISGFNNKLSVDSSEADRIIGALELKKEEVSILSSQLDNFNFFLNERNINKELIDEIEEGINNLNSEEYNITYEIRKISDALEKKVEFDIDSIRKIYEEASVHLPDQLVKSYAELEKFNKSITQERNQYLSLQLAEYNTRLSLVRSNLEELNKRRSSALSLLNSDDTFLKFKSYQVNLAKSEGEISRLEEQLRNINKIGLLKEEIDSLDEQIHGVTKEIQSQITTTNSTYYSEIRRSFNNSFRYIFNVPALIFIKQNNVGNIDFRAEVSRENEIEITAEGQGYTYEKMLCICFDLSILIAYHKDEFYKFVYHDGSLEGLDSRKKLNYIELVRRYCKDYGIQYIFTSIEDDIPMQVRDKIRQEDICVELNDSGDEGKLFEMSF